MAAQPLGSGQCQRERRNPAPTRRPRQGRHPSSAGPEKREPCRHQRHSKGDKDGELVRLDKEGFANPEKPGEEVSKTEPPSGRSRAHRWAMAPPQLSCSADNTL